MAGLGVDVSHSKDKGRGLFATRDYECGEVIFTESPLVSCQFSWNKLYKYVACDYCMRSLETAQDMCRRLCADEDIVLPHPECCEVEKNNHVICESCGVVYCSTQCRDRAFEEYHKTLCLTDQNPIKNDLMLLDETWRQMHYPPETASIMIIARMIAKIKQSFNRNKILKEFNDFCSKTQNENENIVHKLLGKKFEDQIEVLLQQLSSCLYEEAVSDWFTAKGFRKLLGLLGTNQQGIGSTSLSVWVNNCDKFDLEESERSELDAYIDKLYEELEDISGDFLNCEGVGLYRLQSSCNHSCDPEAEICFEHKNNVLTLRAIKPVPSGSEIHISYLGECDLSRSRHSRQKILSENYLFNCHCQNCSDQSNDPCVTSEEESDDSMET